MKFSFVIFLFLFSVYPLHAQFDNESLIVENDSISGYYETNSKPVITDQKYKWNGSVGASYIFSKNMGSINALHAGYGFTRPLNSKFSIGAGVLASSYFPVTGFFNHTESDFQNFSKISIYGTGSYQLNERLVLYGTGIKHLVEFGPDTPFSSCNYNEISIGTSLKLSNSISIGASVHFVDRPVYYSPFFDRGPHSSGFPNSW